jgi:hypothetical protein
MSAGLKETHSTAPHLWLLASVSTCPVGKQPCLLGLAAVTGGGGHLLTVSGCQGCRAEARWQHGRMWVLNLPAPAGCM